MKREYECNNMRPKTPKLVNKLRYDLLKKITTKQHYTLIPGSRAPVAGGPLPLVSGLAEKRSREYQLFFSDATHAAQMARRN